MINNKFICNFQLGISKYLKIDIHSIDNVLWIIFSLFSFRTNLKQKYNILKYIFYRVADSKNTLMRIFICPSHVCQCKCVHCYEGEKDKKNYDNKIFLTTEEIKKVVDDFSKYLHGLDVYFCSGEILLRKDIFELIEYSKEKGLIVNIVTNGILLDDNMILNLKKAGLTKCIVSIDYPNDNIHDKLRGFNGCYEKATNGIRLAVKAGLDVTIWTYISRSNKNDLKKLGSLANKLKITSPVFVYFPLLSGKLFNKFEENLTFEEREYIRKTAKHPISLLFPFEKTICTGAGRYHLSIEPSGDMTPCPATPYSYGNIKKVSLIKSFKYMKEDCQKFNSSFTGQCMVNNLDYRTKCKGKLIR
ncbi:MAG: radical SAM protein [Actinobacteria bacterium]|nr:radical SAM protein [Actinomycetota bacterium]